MKYPLAFIAFSLAFCAACSTIQFQSAASKFEADVKSAEAWAQTPTGQTVLTALSTGVNLYVTESGGGVKSQANAQALGAAARSLETGKTPDVQTVANAVGNYVPSGTTKNVLTAIVASATTAPSPNGGLEIAAKTIESAAVTQP